MAKRDLYEVLGVSRKASHDEIKANYRRLIKDVHPDLNPGNKKAEKIAKELTAAYAVLGKEDARKLYDRHGHPNSSLDEAVNRAWTQRSSHSSRHRASAYRTDWDMFIDELAREWDYARAFDTGIKNAGMSYKSFMDKTVFVVGTVGPLSMAAGYYIGSTFGLDVTPYNWVLNDQSIAAFGKPSTEAGIVGAMFTPLPMFAVAGAGMFASPILGYIKGFTAYRANQDKGRLS